MSEGLHVIIHSDDYEFVAVLCVHFECFLVCVCVYCSLQPFSQSYMSQDGLASQGLIHHSGISMATHQLHQLNMHSSSSMHLPV